jgi:hypothetical protein
MSREQVLPDGDPQLDIDQTLAEVIVRFVENGFRLDVGYEQILLDVDQFVVVVDYFVQIAQF